MFSISFSVEKVDVRDNYILFRYVSEEEGRVISSLLNNLFDEFHIPDMDLWDGEIDLDFNTKRFKIILKNIPKEVRKELEDLLSSGYYFIITIEEILEAGKLLIRNFHSGCDDYMYFYLYNWLEDD